MSDPRFYMKTYKFIDHEEYEGDTEEKLQSILDDCEFIVTDYGTMYPTKGCSVMLLNYWSIVHPDGSTDRYSKIEGGFKLETK